jgi:hypothetical protein
MLDELGIYWNNTSLTAPVVQKLIGASGFYVPTTDDPWVQFEFDDPAQETLIRLRYL